MSSTAGWSGRTNAQPSRWPFNQTTLAWQASRPGRRSQTSVPVVSSRWVAARKPSIERSRIWTETPRGAALAQARAELDRRRARRLAAVASRARRRYRRSAADQAGAAPRPDRSRPCVHARLTSPPGGLSPTDDAPGLGDLAFVVPLISSPNRPGRRKRWLAGGRAGAACRAARALHARRSCRRIRGRPGRRRPRRRAPEPTVAPRTKTTSLPTGGTCGHSTSAPLRERSRRRASISPNAVCSLAASSTRARLAERLPAGRLRRNSLRPFPSFPAAVAASHKPKAA